MVDWNKVIEEASLPKLRALVDGEITYREFESYGAECRTVLRRHRMQKARQLAAKAIRRREA